MFLKFKYWLYTLLLCAGFATGYAQNTLYVYAGHSTEFGYKNSFLTQAGAGLQHPLSKRLDGGLEIYSYKFWNPDYSTIGFGLRPELLLKTFERKNISSYAEMKGGPIYMLPRHPHQSLNYSFSLGLGIESNFYKSCRLRTTVIYNHFSNGKRKDNLINPMWDGLGINLTWIFK